MSIITWDTEAISGRTAARSVAETFEARAADPILDPLEAVTYLDAALELRAAFGI